MSLSKMSRECITILAGNPGSGKSTLLNSLAGKITFPSGVSIGEGLTTVVQTARGTDGKLYGDTPGLDDVAIRAKAAGEMNKILRANNAIKLVFVVTLEAGRVKPADKTTMEVILDALPDSTNKFTIIINKMEKSVYNQLQEPEKLKRLLVSLVSEKHTTSHIHFILKDKDADGEDNVMISNIQPLRTALDLAPIFEYNSKEVKDIKHDAFEAMREKFAEDLENIKKANAEQLDRMARQHDEAIARLRADAQRERDEFARRMDQMSADHQ
eukprot:gene25231-27303_t